MAEQTFTQAELAQYNGIDKPQKYVAIDGVVYDVTNASAWRGANHHGNVAGQDLSASIKKSPHKLTVLTRLPVVGTYIG